MPKRGAEKAAHLQKYCFKPGQSGNPHGRPKFNHRDPGPNVVTKECLNRISRTLFDGSLDDLKALQQAEDVTPIERLCIGVVIRAYDKGDPIALNILLDRFIGKVADKKAITVDTPAGAAAAALDELSDEELEAREAALANTGI